MWSHEASAAWKWHQHTVHRTHKTSRKAMSIFFRNSMHGSIFVTFHPNANLAIEARQHVNDLQHHAHQRIGAFSTKPKRDKISVFKWIRSSFRIAHRHAHAVQRKHFTERSSPKDFVTEWCWQRFFGTLFLHHWSIRQEGQSLTVFWVPLGCKVVLRCSRV